MDSYLLSQTEDEIRTILDNRVIISTKAGFVKELNEDAVGYALTEEGALRISIADGHWGQEAAESRLPSVRVSNYPYLLLSVGDNE